MRVLLIIIASFFATNSICQTINGSAKPNELVRKYAEKNLDNYSIDTFYLDLFKPSKVVAYSLSKITIYIDYEVYIKEFSSLWEFYKKGMARIKKFGEYGNSEYKQRWVVIDSIYQITKKCEKIQDTFYVSQKAFNKVGLRPLISFDKLIEKGNCQILDNNNIRQKAIIRLKGSWQRGPLQGWSGRKYFLFEQKYFFLEVSDLHS
jgi:hypothetical protein